MEQLIGQCLLKDEEFMQDYLINHTIQTVRDVRYVGTIRNSTQSVLIRKQKFEVALLSRFKALYRLFRHGVILADNMFIKREADGYYFYIIEAYLISKKQSKFVSLKTLIEDGKCEDKMKPIAQKIRLLLQECHKEGENYLCLMSQRVIVQQQPEINVQLAPYELDQASFLQSLRAETDLMANAYLAPEIFDQVLLGGEGRLQVNKKDLITADYWSLGCIMLEMFVLASPAFLSVGLFQQQKRFKQVMGSGMLSAWVSAIDCSLQSLAFNCLAKKQNRSMNLTAGSFADTFAQPPSIVQNPAYNNREQLALSAIAEKGEESSLSLCLLALLDYQIREQLRVVVHLFTKFTFYFEKPTSNERILRLDKTINVDNSFDQFSRLLNRTLQIQFFDGQWRGSASINLGMLVLRQDNKRIWRKPLVGSYPISGSSAKIRISCILASPPDIEPEPLGVHYSGEKIEQILNRSQSPQRFKPQNHSPAKMLDLPSSARKEKPKSSILAISEELSNLTMLWRNKESETDSQRFLTKQKTRRI